jgi:two-component system sensor kinase FixL
MTHLSYNEPDSWSTLTSGRAGELRAAQLLGLAMAVGLAYYVGTKIGFGLTLKPSPVSTLWPPNSILLAAFLLTARSSWWAVLGGAFVAHLVGQLQSGIPLPLVLGWFVTNASEGLIGATIVRHFIKEPLEFCSLRQVAAFVAGAAFLGTALSSFLDAGMVSLVGWGSAGFWDVWLMRTPSNVLASLTLVPVILTWSRADLSEFRAAPLKRYLEAALLGLGLLAVCVHVFLMLEQTLASPPVLLYAPLPFLLWATIRFGPRGTSSCLLIVAGLAIWGAVGGSGPFSSRSPAENALSMQLFLTIISVPLLTLAAVICERESTQGSARKDQERLNLALSASQVGTWEWCIADDTVEMSPKSREILGVTDDRLVHSENDFLNLVSTEDRGGVARAMLDAMSRGSAYECEFRVRLPDESVRWVLGKGKVLYDNTGKPERMLGVNVDITERRSAAELKQEEAALRQSEARFRELADTTPVMVWQSDADRVCNFFNKHWLAFTGRTLEQESGDGWSEQVHPDDLQRCLTSYFAYFDKRQPFTMEFRLRRADGEYRWLLDNGVPRYTATGQFVGYIGSCVDITEQKLAEQALRESGLELEERVAERTTELSSAVVALRDEIADRIAAERALRSSEERFGKAFHSSPDAIAIVRQRDYEYIEVNEKWEAMFGYTRAEALGRTAEDLGLVVLSDEIRTARATLNAYGSLRDHEMDLRNKAGDVFRIMMVADTVDMAGEACYIVILRDITERKRAHALLQEQQRELAHLGRVAALGELSGALAHELNQPLAAILTNARAAQRILSMPEPSLAELKDILEDIALDDRRAGDVISQLRGLLKKGDLQIQPISLEKVIKEVIALLHSDLIERRVLVETRLSSDLPPVMGDRVQLQQVLLNLIMNACDAMADQYAATRQILIVTGLTPEGQVQLSVSDQGVGIPPARLSQIFDPFVTTKEHGLGLGLAICQSIVTAHGGRLWAANNPDRGTTLHMVLNPADNPQPRSDWPKETSTAAVVSQAGIR